MTLIKQSSIAHRVVYEIYGAGYHECYFCGAPIKIRWLESKYRSSCRLIGDGAKICVHHIDEERTNNFYKNLAIAHRSCHSKFHQTGRRRSRESKNRHRLAHLGKPGTKCLPGCTCGRHKGGGQNKGQKCPPNCTCKRHTNSGRRKQQ